MVVRSKNHHEATRCILFFFAVFCGLLSPGSPVCMRSVCTVFTILGLKPPEWTPALARVLAARNVLAILA